MEKLTYAVSGTGLAQASPHDLSLLEATVDATVASYNRRAESSVELQSSTSDQAHPPETSAYTVDHLEKVPTTTLSTYLDPTNVTTHWFVKNLQCLATRWKVVYATLTYRVTYPTLQK